MRLGIGTYTYTWAIGVPGAIPAKPMRAMDLLSQAAACGVRVVQFCDNLPLTSLAPQELSEVTSFAREHSIAIEIGTRGILDTANLLANLELARNVHGAFVRVVTDSRHHQPSPRETVELLRPLMLRFADAGVRLAIENHDRFSCATLAHMVEDLDPAWAGVCLDTVNSFGALEGPEIVVKTLAPYTLNLHVKDFTIARVSSQMGFLIKGCPAGQGRLNIPWLLGELRQAGKDVNAILELWTPRNATLAKTVEQEAKWAQESLQYLRQHIPH